MKKIITLAAIGSFALMLSACDVEQTEEGEMPDVDVSAEGGNMPEFDVDAADVDVEMEEKTIEVPVVDVDEADAGGDGEN